MKLKEIISFLAKEGEVESIRSSEAFRSSNLYWNTGGFNKKRKIGYLMHLIDICKPESIADWIFFYLTDGSELEFELADNLPVNVKERGRSLKYLTLFSNSFREYLMSYSDIRISEEDALKFVLIRIFYETYEGYLREENTKIALKKFFKHYKISDNSECLGISKGKLDIDYAVDCLLLDKDNKPLCGVQIKSNNFKNFDAKRMNNRKHGEFKAEFGLPVFYILADKNGHIDCESLSTLHNHLKNNYLEKRKVGV